MNIIQKYKLYRNVRNSINPVGCMRGLCAEQYSIIENGQKIVCTHREFDYSSEGAGLSYMHITDFGSNKTEQINGQFARIMFNLLEKKNRTQVKSK